MGEQAAGAPAPLDGIKVLDMSRVFAGPVAGRILSDLGAEVVKVEPPEGDVTRLWGRKAAGLSTYYVQQNVGKRNISIDLRVEGGADLIKQLVAEAWLAVVEKKLRKTKRLRRLSDRHCPNNKNRPW